MSEQELQTNKQWSEEERLALAAKLDAELDAFIDGLEKKRYEEGWPEDRWEEEMDKHPFFMKQAPKPGDEVHPMFEGLQKLKYDPEENTLEELALNYKEDGNFYMKYKKFRMAVFSFTEGIKVKCEKPEVQAVLYNNRSAAHYFLQNYRSSLNDALRALEYKSDYTKARWRAALCAEALQRYEECRDLCAEIYEADASHRDAKKLMIKCDTQFKVQKRNQRKEAADEQQRLERHNKLVSVLEERKIKFADLAAGQKITTELLRPKYLPLENFPVEWMEDTEQLKWPVAFSYPEFLTTDFQQEVAELATIDDCLCALFAEPMSIDKENKYNADNVNVYYENSRAGLVHKVDVSKTLEEILDEKTFFVFGGALLFYIVPKDSRVEKEYVYKPRRAILKI